MTTKPKASPDDLDLKSVIIEFMRSRPFLWNSKHPNYKDHKRREQEFQACSLEIGFPVQEIKRVWHVLRTNFFRAHKILIDKPRGQSSSSNNNKTPASGASENGEKLWKYYLAMNFVLEGTSLAPSPSIHSNNNHNDESSTSKETRQHLASGNKNSKLFKDSRGLKRDSSAPTNDTGNIDNFSDVDKVVAGSNVVAVTTTTSSSSCDTSSTSLANNSSLVCVNSHPNQRKSHNASKNLNNLSALGWESYIDADEDHLYARSLSSSLKKFDPTTKEVIKLKFQEIIVDYMQRQQQQQQTNNATGAQHATQLQNTRHEA